VLQGSDNMATETLERNVSEANRLEPPGQQVSQQAAQNVTQVGGPLPAHKTNHTGKGPRQHPLHWEAGLCSATPPLSSTHTPGTQAPVASLSVALSLSLANLHLICVRPCLQ
jgi:hypothetical protein